MKMLDRIMAAQEDRGWNDSDFARHLGISQSVWSRIKSGQRPLGNWAFMGAVGRAIPELQWYIAQYLFEGGNEN